MTSVDFKKALENLNAKCTFVDNSFTGVNLFGILGIERREVLICRVLGFLLQPNSEVGIGAEPLRVFLNHIKPGCSYTNQELQEAHVSLEEHTDDDRRVDITIYVGRNVYPIEVKVDTGDRPAQLFDYYHYYKSRCRIDKIYYLTPNRREPNICSLRPREKERQEILPKGVIQCLSFKDDIDWWLEALNQIYPVVDNYGFLINQFKDVIKVMCADNQNEEKLYEAIGLHKAETFRCSNEMKALLHIMSLEQKNVWETIRDAYLRSALKLGSKYELESTPGGADIDGHSLYVIKNIDTKKELAWICVDTNLYIVSRHSVNGLKGRGSYYWKHLSPKGTGGFQLNKVNTSISDTDEIPIGDLLDQIEATF